MRILSLSARTIARKYSRYIARTNILLEIPCGNHELLLWRKFICKALHSLVWSAKLWPTHGTLPSLISRKHQTIRLELWGATMEKSQLFERGPKNSAKSSSLASSITTSANLLMSFRAGVLEPKQTLYPSTIVQNKFYALTSIHTRQWTRLGQGRQWIQTPVKWDTPLKQAKTWRIKHAQPIWSRQTRCNDQEKWSGRGRTSRKTQAQSSGRCGPGECPNGWTRQISLHNPLFFLRKIPRLFV